MNIKDEYIKFFISKGHKLIPSAPIVPENDPTCLFNTAGMQPLVPYLMGEEHPEGSRLTDVQKCFRLTDLEEVGDKTHHTFFEMLGNWSLGDYFKKETITWSYEFLTQHLHIDPKRLAVTVFKGNDVVGPDYESAQIWKNLGIAESHIAYLGEEDNWWGPAGEIGPCGPDTEIFYFRSDDDIPDVYDPSDERYVEIWNNVFMQYKKESDGTLIPLLKKNVDTGMGVERITAVLEHKDDNYLSSLWIDIINKIEELSNKPYQGNEIAMRIIADHIRAIVIISGDNALIKPSNTDQGYILRRLIRRMLRYAKKLDLDIHSDFDKVLALMIIDKYQKYYEELVKNKDAVLEVLDTEKKQFSKTLDRGLKEFDKIITTLKDKQLDATSAFKLYDTYGFPIELTEEMAHEQGIDVDIEGFKQKFIEHQEKSRSGAAIKFKGGLSSNSDMNIKYHTATHLLNAALKEILGTHVHQKGSNITDERLRFDFSHDVKMTKEQLEATQSLVNTYIKQGLEVTKEEMTKEEAIKIGAEAMFIEKYGAIVNVYKIGNVSTEICGGPHVSNTSELGTFKIIKEEASSAGVRRIKAILE